MSLTLIMNTHIVVSQVARCCIVKHLHLCSSVSLILLRNTIMFTHTCILTYKTESQYNRMKLIFL